MKTFGYLLIAFISVLTAALTIPLFVEGRVIYAVGLIGIACALCTWTYAIYGPLNSRYESGKSRLLGAISGPIAAIFILALGSFFVHRGIRAIVISHCVLEEIRPGKGALLREISNGTCLHLGPYGYGFLHASIGTAFLYLVWHNHVMAKRKLPQLTDIS